ncbi:MAG: hypothetical protein ACON35_00230 [Candidatus Marinamargulisbacteria bacterium]
MSLSSLSLNLRRGQPAQNSYNRQMNINSQSSSNKYETDIIIEDFTIYEQRLPNSIEEFKELLTDKTTNIQCLKYQTFNETHIHLACLAIIDLFKSNETNKLNRDTLNEMIKYISLEKLNKQEGAGSLTTLDVIFNHDSNLAINIIQQSKQSISDQSKWHNFLHQLVKQKQHQLFKLLISRNLISRDELKKFLTQYFPLQTISSFLKSMSIDEPTILKSLCITTLQESSSPLTNFGIKLNSMRTSIWVNRRISYQGSITASLKKMMVCDIDESTLRFHESIEKMIQDQRFDQSLRQQLYNYAHSKSAYKMCAIIIDINNNLFAQFKVAQVMDGTTIQNRFYKCKLSDLPKKFPLEVLASTSFASEQTKQLNIMTRRNDNHLRLANSSNNQLSGNRTPSLHHGASSSKGSSSSTSTSSKKRKRIQTSSDIANKSPSPAQNTPMTYHVQFDRHNHQKIRVGWGVPINEENLVKVIMENLKLSKRLARGLVQSTQPQNYSSLFSFFQSRIFSLSKKVLSIYKLKILANDRINNRYSVIDILPGRLVTVLGNDSILLNNKELTFDEFISIYNNEKLWLIQHAGIERSRAEQILSELSNVYPFYDCDKYNDLKDFIKSDTFRFFLFNSSKEELENLLRSHYAPNTYMNVLPGIRIAHVHKNAFIQDSGTILSFKDLKKLYKEEMSWFVTHSKINEHSAFTLFNSLSENDYTKVKDFICSDKYKFFLDILNGEDPQVTSESKLKNLKLTSLINSCYDDKTYFQLLPGIKIAYLGNNSFKVKNDQESTMSFPEIKQLYNSEKDWLIEHVGFSNDEAKVLLTLKIQGREFSCMKRFIESDTFKFFRDTLNAPRDVLCTLFLCRNHHTHRYRYTPSKFGKIMKQSTLFQIIPGEKFVFYNQNRNLLIKTTNQNYTIENLMEEFKKTEKKWLTNATKADDEWVNQYLKSSVSNQSYHKIKSFYYSSYFNFFKTTLNIPATDIFDLVLKANSKIRVKINDHSPEFEILNIANFSSSLVFDIRYPCFNLENAVPQRFHYSSYKADHSNISIDMGKDLSEFQSDINKMIDAYNLVSSKLKETHPGMSFSTYWDKIKDGIKLTLENHTISASHPFYDFEKKKFCFKFSTSLNPDRQPVNAPLLKISTIFKYATQRIKPSS